MNQDPASVVIPESVDRVAVESIERLRSLLVASKGGEEATQAEVARQLRELGIDPEEIRAAPSDIQPAGEFAAAEDTDPRVRTTIAARLSGTGGGRSLILWAHPDGMPFDGGEGWRHNPFAGTVEDGKIYGWGVADDLSGVAATIATVHVLQEAGIRLDGDLLLASTPSKGHASGILAAMQRGYVADGGLYLHPAESGNGLNDIKALAPGMLRFTVSITGRQPDTREPNHALYAHRAVNPVDLMIQLIVNLQALDERRAARIHHPVLDAFAGRSTSMLVSTIQAGESVSRVPRVCTATITFQLPPGESPEDVKREIEDVVEQVTGSHPWLRDQPPVITWLFGTTGVEVPNEHPLYRAVESSISSVTGTSPAYYPGHTASEIRQPMLTHNMPAVGIGPFAGSLTQAGGADEWLDLRDYQRMIATCALTASHWCGID